jgi:serine phosphatase RsbU (regulator of sigma subunit)
VTSPASYGRGGLSSILMSENSTLIEHLTTLNEIAEVLNRSSDVRTALHDALARLVPLMGLETGWIFLKDPAATDLWWGPGYRLVASHNLPPALALDSQAAWERDCDCQRLCDSGTLNQAYNEVVCKRTAEAPGDRRGITVHASTPLRSGEKTLGILNVAASDWDSFSPGALTLLTNVGNQMGVALERARLFDLQLERRVNEQAVLLEFSNQLLGQLRFEDLVGYLASAVKELLHTDACALLLPSEAPGELEFTAAVGWRTDPVSAGRRAPANLHTGPGMVVQTPQPHLVEDLQKDAIAPRPPEWLLEEGFRGHAVVPLIVEGRPLGALMIDTREPRLIDESDLHFMQLMANQAAMAVQNARLHEEEIRRKELEANLSVARTIQLGMLPTSPPRIAGWGIAAYYRAAQQVGGDFFDFFEVLKDKGSRAGPLLGMVIADVADKGVAAALYMALSRTLIRTTGISDRSPAATLKRANELMLKDSQADIFLSAFFAILDPRSGRLRYANAGHNRPLWRHAATTEIETLGGKGTVLGVLENVEIEDRQITIDPGDILVFYTDGVSEALDAQGDVFGTDRLSDALRRSSGASADAVLNGIISHIEAFAGDMPQSDDLTLFVVRRNHKGGETDQGSPDRVGVGANRSTSPHA